MHKIRLYNKIGDGAYSTVHKISSNNQFYALKKIPIDDHYNPLEFYIMTSFPGCYILQAESIYIGKNNINIIQPLAAMDLNVWIQKYHNESITDRWLMQLLFAVRQLHQSKIIHGDIKPDNIVIKGEDVYLTDFSLSVMNNKECAKKLLATAPYRPLEVFHNEPISIDVDIWSLACTMYCIKKGKRLFPTQREDFEYVSCLMKWCEDYKVFNPYNDKVEEHRGYRTLDLNDNFDRLILTMLRDRIDVDKVLGSDYFKDKTIFSIPKLIETKYKVLEKRFLDIPLRLQRPVADHAEYLFDKCKDYSNERISLTDIGTACIIIADRCWNGKVEYDLYTPDRDRMRRVVYFVLRKLRYRLFE